MKELNTNEMVRVILTERGAAIYNADAAKMNAHMATTRSSYRVTYKLPGDMHETSLWRLMQLYGPHIYMGMREMPFLDNVVEIVQ